MEENGFSQLALEEQQQKQNDTAEGFRQLYNQSEQYFSEQKKALNTTTLLTALALSDKNPMTDAVITQSRTLLDEGKENLIRSEVANQRLERQLASVGRIASTTNVNVDPQLFNDLSASYNKLKTWDIQEKQRTAIEEAAIDKIRSMAMSDPVQAKILLDNLEYGTADQTTSDWAVKMAVLRQRAEELDDEYSQQGWGKWMLNSVLNFAPLNFNFQRTGVVGTASLIDLLHTGGVQQRESNELWTQASQMSNEEFAKFAAKDGPLMESVRDNATTLFDLTADPAAAVEILDGLMATGDQTANYNNVWGAIEIGSVLPWKTLTSTTRMIASVGDVKSAVRNMDNALHIMDTKGPEEMVRATGVTEKEIAEELSVSAVKPRPADEVPLSSMTADRRAAAQQAIDDLFVSPERPVFFSPEEVENWVEGAVDDFTRRHGTPVKDVTYNTESLSGGLTNTQVTFTIGRKDGHGFASEGAAKRAVRTMGFADSAEVFQDAQKGIKPPRSKVKIESSAQTEDGLTAYRVRVDTPNGDELKVSVMVDKEGLGDISVAGLAQNTVGPSELRSIAAQLADEIPELKVLRGDRTTGARAKSGSIGEIGEVNVEKLRGQIQTFRDSSGQWFAKITRNMPVEGWLTGELKPDQMGFVGKMLGRWFSPAARLSDPILHGQAIDAGSYLNRAARHIDDDIMNTFRKLPGESRKVVKALGTLSNQKEKWLTPEEIHVAVQGAYGRRATEAELKGYEALRMANDMDWELRNSYMYVDGIQKGKETVSFGTRWGEDFVDEDVIVDYNLEVVPTERVFDVSRNKHYVHGRNSLDTKTLKAMKNNGYVMMTFPDGFRLPEGVIVNKVLVKKSDVTIKPLKREQLAYAEGGHRMYADRVFVKQGRKGKQVDTGSEYLLSPLTHRTAANIAEGKKWAEVMERARLRLKADPSTTAQQLDDEIFLNDNKMFPTGQEYLDGMIDGTFDKDNPFEAVFDREMPSMYNTAGEDMARMFNEDELGINGYYRTTGRMYTSSKGEILRSTMGEVADVLDPYETLSRSLQQITRQIGLYTYKTNAIERFVNTYSKWLNKAPENTNNIRMLTEAKVVDTAPMDIRNQIEGQRNAITNVLRFETDVDKHTRQMYQSLAESVIGDGSSKARKLAHDAVWWWKENNPVSVLRGLAFDSKLGMFNPGQLLVQSSTMFSALAMNPKYGWFGMSGLYPMHAYILKGGSENVLETMARRGMDKAMGFKNVDEFKEYARHAYQHGFMEMNGSHIMINNHGPNAHFGSFAEKQQKVREQARIFFYTSEIWNRLVAYRIAWGKTTEQGLRPNMPQFDATILKLADDYSFNMTNESASYWQKGLLSIPTQFWAYNLRMIEAMFGTKFTPAERIRLGLMQFGMAGTAGIPGVQAISEYIKQKNGQAPPIDSLTGALDRGLVDYLNYQLTGQDILIGERIGTGPWASDTVKAIFGASEYGTQSLDEMLGGATWTITKNTSESLWNLAKYAAIESGDQGYFGQITKDRMLESLKEISTLGNTAKAVLIWQHGMLKSNSGKIQASNLPAGNALYQALSFRPAKAEEMSYLMAYRKDKSEALREYSDQLRNWRQEALNTGDYDKYWTRASVLINLIPYEDRRTVIQSANRTMDKSFYDFLERKVAEEKTQSQLVEDNQ